MSLEGRAACPTSAIGFADSRPPARPAATPASRQLQARLKIKPGFPFWVLVSSQSITGRQL